MYRNSFGQTPSASAPPPPPCDNEDNVRSMLASAGSPAPVKTNNPEADSMVLGMTLIAFVASNGLDPGTVTSQQVCDLLVEKSGFKLPATKSSTGFPWKPVVLVGGGLVLAAGIYVAATRKKR